VCGKTFFSQNKNNKFWDMRNKKNNQRNLKDNSDSFVRKYWTAAAAYLTIME
jgi:hypothetical protein